MVCITLREREREREREGGDRQRNWERLMNEKEREGSQRRTCAFPWR